jgi:hypothetical protein
MLLLYNILFVINFTLLPMNALVYATTHDTSHAVLNSICELIAERKFKKAEEQVLEILARILEVSYTSPQSISEAIELINGLYEEFNSYYLQWSRTREKDEVAEVEELYSRDHSNFFIAHCTDVECMDDMLYEVRSYLFDLQNESQKEEALYHVNCYRRILS